MKKPEQLGQRNTTQTLPDDKASKVTESDDETGRFRTLSVEELEALAARDKATGG